jgi:hypothetical protein
MKRQKVLEQITAVLGSVPDWLGNLPDLELEHVWGLTAWFLGDSKLSAREKALVAFGAATASHCPY